MISHLPHAQFPPRRHSRLIDIDETGVPQLLICGEHIETRAEAPMSPHKKGDWSVQGWNIGDRVLPPKGY